MKIGIVGVGLLGASMAAALKGKMKGEVSIVAFSSERTLEKARKMNLFDGFHSYEEVADNIDGLDVLFLCSPIMVIMEHIEAIGKCKPLGKPLVITDVGSTKRQIMACAEASFGTRQDLIFIGGHPMAGSEFRGIDANDPFLYENAIYVVTPTPQTSDIHVNRLLTLVKRVGAIPLIMEPAKHDRVAAGISHLPQMMASGLVDMITKEENSTLSKTLCAGGFRDMTRIASSHYRMWKDIIYTNKDNIFDMIDNYIAELQLVKKSIEEGTLEDVFENARITRDGIPKGTRGIIQPNFEIMVRIPDEPGMLLKISTILAEENINIKDINIQRSRENEGGQLRLGFETMTDCENAVKQLQFRGYYSRIIE